MSTEITRLAEGTRVIRGNGTTRGTVAGYHRSSLVVTVDGGGTDSSPAAHRAWRELTAEEQAEEQQAPLAPAAPGSTQLRSFAVCPSCGFTDRKHSDSCPRSLARFRMSWPALQGEVIQQGHADACALYGHATWHLDGQLQPRCPRCGEQVWS